MNPCILLIHCKDQAGLVYKVTQVIFKHGLNIISNDEFVERTLEHFFMRTEFSGDFNKDTMMKELTDVLPFDASIKLSERKKRDICILVTKEHHCLSDLLIRHHFRELDYNIQCVISNYQNLQDFISKFNIPFHHISHEGISREDHEAAILRVVQQYNPEFIVLAKYMRVLSPTFVSQFTNRIINIHHSFLPAFAGANPYNQAYARGVKIIGATAHFVTDSLDEGPIIAQSVIPVAHTHSAKEMAQAGKDVEKIVLARSLKLVFAERIFVYKNRTIIFE
jgi:formyltetrahydrofolate deformylase